MTMDVYYMDYGLIFYEDAMEYHEVSDVAIILFLYNCRLMYKSVIQLILFVTTHGCNLS